MKHRPRNPAQPFHFLDEQAIISPFVQIWKSEGWFSSFLRAPLGGSPLSPEFGFLFPGKRHKSAAAAIKAVWKRFPDARIIHRGKEVRKP